MESRGAKLIRLAKRRLNFDSENDPLRIATRKNIIDAINDESGPNAGATVTRNVSPQSTPKKSDSKKNKRSAKKRLNFDSENDALSPIIFDAINDESESTTRAIVTKNVSPERTPNKLETEKDFSGTDSGDEFQPLPLNSSSSSSSSSSDSSSSSSSEDEDETQIEAAVAPPGTSRDATGINEHATENRSALSKNTRKRACNRSNWKRNITKRLKNTGQGYTSRTGKSVSAKFMGPTCPQKCRLGCSQNFTEEERLSLFKNYWELGDLGRQREYLNTCIKPLEIKYRRIKVDGNEPRKPNTAYYITNQSKLKRVCKLFLLNTLGIAERTLRSVINAKNEDNWGTAPQDKRGRHNNHFTVPEEIKQSVQDHINSIPRIESHYLRANTTREFIDGGLTVAEMHRNYESSRRQYNLPAANYHTYLHIFNTEYNIGLFFPKKDQCDVCVSYKNAPAEEKPNLYPEYKLHLEEKSLSRIEKKRDMDNSVTNDSLIVSTFDLQAVLPCPVGDSSSFFYKTRLNCYNFTVTTGKNEKTTCYFWHEGLGHRGAIEIGSCVYKYLEDVAAQHPNCNIIFYSDNCCGQQKNRFILAMYLYAVSNLSINSITHKFLIRGHTQNEGDTAHSIIEKSIKRERKSGPIYVPEHYISAIRKAKKSGQPFTVNELNYDDFYDLKILSEALKLNTAKNVNGEAIKLTEIKMIRFTKNETTYEYKTSYKTENVLKALIVLEQTRRTRNTQSAGTSASVVHDIIQLQPAYKSKIPVADRKKKDIMELIQKNIVPNYYSEFYKNL